MVFSRSPSIPSGLIEIVLRVESSAEISTLEWEHALPPCLPT
jgi:hypothetical protein